MPDRPKEPPDHREGRSLADDSRPDVPWRKWLRNRFFAGLFVALPAVFSILLLSFVYSGINSISQPLLQVVAARYQDLLPGFLLVQVPGTTTMSIPLVGFILTIAFVLLLGILMGHWVGGRIDDFIAKQVMDSVQSLGKSPQAQFSKVVLIPYPGIPGKLVAFVIQTYTDSTGKSIAAIFLPTAPNPLTGFVMLMPESEVENSDMSIEDATKVIVSIGVVAPKAFTFPENKQFRIEFTKA